MANSLLIETVTTPPFMENCYVVASSDTREAIVIDPGFEPERIAEVVRELGVTPKEIIATHAHIDHAGAVAPLGRLLGVPFAVHPAERPLLAHLPAAAAMFGLPPVEVPEIDRELAPGQRIELGGASGEILFTPGHSPGGCCISFAEEGAVFVGDTLFAGSIGRTDLPGGDMQTLLESIRNQLFVLDDDVMAYSGHGPPTTIGVERRSNPFLQ